MGSRSPLSWLVPRDRWVTVLRTESKCTVAVPSPDGHQFKQQWMVYIETVPPSEAAPGCEGRRLYAGARLLGPTRTSLAVKAVDDAALQPTVMTPFLVR